MVPHRGRPVGAYLSCDNEGGIADRTAVVIPIRSFAAGKSRLARALPAAERAELLRVMADGVVRAAEDLPTVIVSSAPEVKFWAKIRDLSCVEDPGSLNGAAAAGVEWARSYAFARVVIAHADLPLATTFSPVVDGAEGYSVVVVRGNRGRGSPVLSISTMTPFRFAYGPGSFDRHVREARGRNLPVRTVLNAGLATDLDTPEDFNRLRGLISSTSSGRRAIELDKYRFQVPAGSDVSSQ